MVKRRGGAEHTGLGGGTPTLMDGQSTGDESRDALINQCAKECYELFFKGTKRDYDSIDAGEDADKYTITFGIEPSYFGDPLKVIRIAADKGASHIETGIAKGYWGSGIRSTRRYYSNYKRSSKFTRFIDKWQPKLFTGGAS